MILNIDKGFIPQVIQLPTSKSYANRALILGAQKKTQTHFEKLPKATDVTNLISALQGIGLNIIINNDELTFLNSFPECEDNSSASKIIEVGEGGTTARFLACMLLKGTKPYVLKLGKRLKERPWDEFISLVVNYGAQCSLNDDELFIQGPIKLPSKIEVDCSRTTQFATGLALCFSPETQVIPTQLETSQSYWEMTLKLIEDFSSDLYVTPIDWSSASYPLAFAALTRETFFPHLFPDKFQADSKFYDLLKSLGLLTQKNDGVLITPTKVTKDVSLDVTDCLDLVPTLVFFLSYVKGQHELIGVENLVFKESDRLHESLRLLKAFGVSYKAVGTRLMIQGSYEKFEESVNLELPDDHRMVMSAALFMRYNEGGSVSPFEAVDKSYPEFFQLFD
ncbi:MAG: hypothetical protein WCY48_05125 [Candidatus Caldatribacteriota bacterium]